MFQPEIIRDLANTHKELFKHLKWCHQNLNHRFVKMEQSVQALILAVASKVPLIFIGPPGTAKSKLIRSFCELHDLVDPKDPGKRHKDYFEYLLTPFTEPAELFGFYDLAKASGEKPELVRLDDYSMQKAKIIYLDEVFNGSSAILNSLLAIMNEGFLHDRGKLTKAEKELIIGATNDVPERPELRAFYDRFVLRCFVSNINPTQKNIKIMMEKGFAETYRRHERSDVDSKTLFSWLECFDEEFKSDVSKKAFLVEEKNYWLKKLTCLVKCVKEHGYPEVSNRRLVQMTRVMMIHAIYRVANNPDEETFIADDLALFPLFFLDREDEEMTKQMTREIKNGR